MPPYRPGQASQYLWRACGPRGAARAVSLAYSPDDQLDASADSPTIVRRVELRLVYASVEANVPTEAEFFVYVAEILADFLPRRIEFAELPFPPQVVARILIDWAGRVDAGTRITIPIPDTAKTAPGLKHLNGHAHAAQTVKEIEAGESRADHDDIEIFDLVVVRPCRLSRAHMVAS